MTFALMITKYCFIISCLFISTGVFCQDDSLATKTLNEIVITATRTLKSTGTLPVPVTVISKKQIQQSGLQKVSDVLQQNGLQLSVNILGQSLQGYPNPFGSGVQLQGLDAGYSLILMDGQPLTGRNAGVLNLDRIPVNNIKQIEIIRGPAASLYGADALAGVINIITDDPSKHQHTVLLSYGSYNTVNTSLTSSFAGKKASALLFAGHNSSNGYDLDKAVYGKTIDASNNNAISVKTSVTLSAKTVFKNTARFFTQKQFNNYLVYVTQQPETVKGEPVENDWGFLNELTHSFDSSKKLLARVYVTGYENNSKVYIQNNGRLFDNSFLKQLLVKNEYVFEAGKKHQQPFLAGAGADYETINSSRYAAKKELNNLYGFVQKEMSLLNKIHFVAGLRYDKHKLYTGQVNPRLAASFRQGRLIMNISYGRGFKAPDFRQQFLFFTNSLVGYTLLGANELYNGLSQMQQTGILDASINISAYSRQLPLLPEISKGFNAELKWQPVNTFKFSAGFFRNDISNLIDRYILPFTKTNGQAVYSYKNIGNVFTSGINLYASAGIGKYITISGSGQYLEAKDKDILSEIKQQRIVKRDPVTYVSSYTTQKEYGGLFNRSKYSGTLQVSYNNDKLFSVSIRNVFTGKAGYSDVNGNGILDDEREYSKGYILSGIVVSKNIKNRVTVQAGADNLQNYTDAARLPHFGGRTWFINTRFDLEKIFDKK